ncbi:DUF4232 domain-containing protein [Streptomyces sp. NPDC047072]|uniref:DUF4232 domain-containing protein n=1 Tax=Streptomyces sp. NPDC047072 TaxID=3154809 RepID=UPI0033D33562
MRRPLISVVTVLLLAGAAGCSSSSSDAEDGSGSGSGSGSSSAADKANTADGSGSRADENQGGSSGSGGTSGGTGGTLGKSGGDGGTSSPSGTGGVLLGADSLPSPAADHCLTKNLKAAAVSTGTGRASVVITNKGSGSCSVRGFPSLLFIGGSGPTELPVDWDGSAADADKFSLASGGSASATLTFTSLDECEEITGVNVVPPGEARPLTLSFTSGGKKQAVHICDTGVRVTAFAPSK